MVNLSKQCTKFNDLFVEEYNSFNTRTRKSQPNSIDDMNNSIFHHEINRNLCHPCRSSVPQKEASKRFGYTPFFENLEIGKGESRKVEFRYGTKRNSLEIKQLGKHLLNYALKLNNFNIPFEDGDATIFNYMQNIISIGQSQSITYMTTYRRNLDTEKRKSLRSDLPIYRLLDQVTVVFLKVVLVYQKGKASADKKSFIQGLRSRIPLSSFKLNDKKEKLVEIVAAIYTVEEYQNFIQAFNIRDSNIKQAIEKFKNLDFSTMPEE